MTLRQLRHSVASDVTSENAHVEVRGLTKSFGTGREAMTALENVDLTVRRGEFVSILGPSGCGKSTLLMILAGLVTSSGGTVLVSGRPVRVPLNDVGIVFQRDLLFDWRTILGNVMLQADIRGLNREASRQKAMSLLEIVGLKGFENRRPWELSGGMRQRAALCRALLHEASVLLLDEPFGALEPIPPDQPGSAGDLDVEQRTAVMVTHSISEAIFLSDRIVVMSGRGPAGSAARLRSTSLAPEPLMHNQPEFVDYQAKLRDSIMH